MSQAQLAKAARVTQPLIARLEKGDQRRTPTFETLFKILKALGHRLQISIHPDRHARAA
jgi:transcriptional regulator with XRE-family HTH domain